MAHARLTHADRPNIQLIQGQRDSDTRTQDSSIAEDVGTRDPPLVHVTGREREREITGRVTAPARSKATGENYLQALADYITTLQFSVDYFQGDGYTLEQDVQGINQNVVFHQLEWEYQRGSVFEVQYDAKVTVGSGVFPTEDAQIPDVSPNLGMDVAARVGGEDLPNHRLMRVSTQFGIDVSSLFNKATAEENDIEPDSSIQTQISFEGTITGTESQRAAKDAALDSLLAESLVTFETRFPGYSLDGVVNEYTSDFEQGTGGNSHDYSLQFQEAREA